MARGSPEGDDEIDVVFFGLVTNSLLSHLARADTEWA